VAAVGCGEAQGDLGGIPADQAPTAIAETVCAKAYDCCTPTQLMGNDLAGTDEATCEQKTHDAFANNLAPVLASQARYRSAYDGAKLGACLAFIRATNGHDLGTTNHFSGIPGCDAFVQPRVALGGGCTYDWECQQGQCIKSAGQIDGLCKPLDAVGESCDSSQCAADLICDGQSKICVAPLADGAPCTRGDLCSSSSCNASTDADAGATTMVCGPPDGGSCFYSSGCSTGGRPPAGSLFAAAMLALVARRRIKRAGDTAPPRR
jgi:MYXO-CTERM domain-containing protein